MDKREIIARERELISAALSIPEEVRYKLCDMGYYNDAMKGYLIAGMRSAGFTDSEIGRAVRGMRSAHDELTAEEAERVYTED